MEVKVSVVGGLDLWVSRDSTKIRELYDKTADQDRNIDKDGLKSDTWIFD